LARKGSKAVVDELVSNREKKDVVEKGGGEKETSFLKGAPGFPGKKEWKEGDFGGGPIRSRGILQGIRRGGGSERRNSTNHEFIGGGSGEKKGASSGKASIAARELGGGLRGER